MTGRCRRRTGMSRRAMVRGLRVPVPRMVRCRRMVRVSMVRPDMAGTGLWSGRVLEPARVWPASAQPDRQLWSTGVWRPAATVRGSLWRCAISSVSSVWREPLWRAGVLCAERSMEHDVDCRVRPVVRVLPGRTDSLDHRPAADQPHAGARQGVRHSGHRHQCDCHRDRYHHHHFCDRGGGYTW